MPATAQLPIRIDPADKGVISRAAALSGVPVTQFVLQNALQAAHQVIAQANTVRISTEAFEKKKKKGSSIISIPFNMILDPLSSLTPYLL